MQTSQNYLQGYVLFALKAQWHPQSPARLRRSVKLHVEREDQLFAFLAHRQDFLAEQLIALDCSRT
jgi:hypothetical protein